MCVCVCGRVGAHPAVHTASVAAAALKGRARAWRRAQVDFRFSSCRGGSRGGAAIAAGLRSTCGLLSLDVSDNSFGPASTALLAATLGEQPLLTSLNVSDIGACWRGEGGGGGLTPAAVAGAGDDGITALAVALRASTRALLRLDVSTNDMTAEGARALASLVKRLRRLTSLRFAENDELGGGGARVLAGAIMRGPRRALASLDASGCGLRDAGALALATAAAACPALAACGLDANALTPAGAAAAARALVAAGKAAPAMDENVEPEEGDEEEEEEEEGEDASSVDSREADEEEAVAGGDAAVDKLTDMMRAL